MDRVIDEAKLMSRIIARVMPILMLVYLVAAGGLFDATLLTFDRRLGRMPENTDRVGEN